MADREDRMEVEEDLLRRCARQDAAAYRELVERLEKPLVNFLYRFVGERHAAEDLFQETFVRVVRSVGQFRPEATLGTWIFTIARNLALDYLKARRRRREMPLEAGGTAERGRVISFRDALPSSSPGPALRVEAAEEERRLMEALKELSPAKHEALVLRVFAGLSYAEIARIVKAPVGTIKFRVHEAVQELGRKLAAQDRRRAAGQGGQP
ncbi:MAG: RNA polymerase sigma factor [Planctomycetota bacterium]